MEDKGEVDVHHTLKSCDFGCCITSGMGLIYVDLRLLLMQSEILVSVGNENSRAPWCHYAADERHDTSFFCRTSTLLPFSFFQSAWQPVQNTIKWLDMSVLSVTTFSAARIHRYRCSSKTCLPTNSRIIEYITSNSQRLTVRQCPQPDIWLLRSTGKALLHKRSDPRASSNTPKDSVPSPGRY